MAKNNTLSTFNLDYCFFYFLLSIATRKFCIFYYADEYIILFIYFYKFPDVFMGDFCNSSKHANSHILRKYMILDYFGWRNKYRRIISPKNIKEF